MCGGREVGDGRVADHWQALTSWYGRVAVHVEKIRRRLPWYLQRSKTMWCMLLCKEKEEEEIVAERDEGGS